VAHDPFYDAIAICKAVEEIRVDDARMERGGSELRSWTEDEITKKGY